MLPERFGVFVALLLAEFWIKPIVTDGHGGGHFGGVEKVTGVPVWHRAGRV